MQRDILVDRLDSKAFNIIGLLPSNVKLPRSTFLNRSPE
jgi:hypothetical protein